jgi:5-methyltetrahydrofolate--homocysteine methyltransferase
MNKNILKHAPNFEETKKRFEAWWNRSCIGRPMMKLPCIREKPLAPLVEIPETNDAEKIHCDPERKVNIYRNFLNSHILMAETLPNTNINIGPGSMATYLGAPPVFDERTVWYEKIVDDWNDFDFKFDPDNYWIKRHLDLIAKQCELSNGEFYVGIPDIIENVDILSSLRGPKDFCYDLIDEPELVHQCLDKLDELYFKYYDAFYDIVKDDEGGSVYTAFEIWGKGKTVKVQCDFSALMNPSQYREFVQPRLAKQCSKMNNSLYHLDGPDAIPHLDAVLEIKEIDALQWVPGSGNTSPDDERWFFIYDKVKAAGKSLWIVVSSIEKADAIVKRYGPEGLYLLFPEMTEKEGVSLLKKAEREWSV